MLFESFDGERLRGLTDTYVPVAAHWVGGGPPLNRLTAVEIIGLTDDGGDAPAALGTLAAP